MCMGLVTTPNVPFDPFTFPDMGPDSAEEEAVLYQESSLFFFFPKDDDQDDEDDDDDGAEDTDNADDDGKLVLGSMGYSTYSETSHKGGKACRIQVARFQSASR